MNAKDFLLDLENVLGSTAKVRFLKVLYRYANIEQSISWFAREAKISINQARLITDLFKDKGLIHYRHAGNASLIRLKKDTVWHEIVQLMMQKHENIKKDFIKDLKDYTKNIKAKVWLYGSFARDEPKKDSDIDVLLVGNVLEKDKQSLRKAEESLSYRYQKNISFLILSRRQLEEGYKGLLKNIMSEGERVDDQGR